MLKTQEVEMASLLKRGNVYYGQWHSAKRSPNRIRISLRTRNRKDARRLLLKLDSAYTTGQWDPWIESIDRCHGRTPNPKRYSYLVDEFLSEKRSTVAETTITSYRSVLRILEQELPSASQKVEAITAAELRSALYGFDISESTRRQRYRIIRVFFNWCLEREYIGASPLTRVPLPRPVECHTYAIRWEDLLLICETIENDYGAKRHKKQGHCGEGDLLWLIPLFKFAFVSGMRISELGRLRWQNVNTESGTILITQQKSRKVSVLPLSTAALDVLECVESQTESPFVFASPRLRTSDRSTHAFCNRVSKSFSTYRERAGLVEPYTFHSMRHGFCSHLAECGATAHVIRVAARHANLATSLRYVHMVDDVVKKELDRVFGSRHGTLSVFRGDSFPSQIPAKNRYSTNESVKKR